MCMNATDRQTNLMSSCVVMVKQKPLVIPGYPRLIISGREKKSRRKQLPVCRLFPLKLSKFTFCAIPAVLAYYILHTPKEKCLKLGTGIELANVGGTKEAWVTLWLLTEFTEPVADWLTIIPSESDCGRDRISLTTRITLFIASLHPATRGYITVSAKCFTLIPSWQHNDLAAMTYGAEGSANMDVETRDHSTVARVVATTTIAASFLVMVCGRFTYFDFLSC